MIAMLALDGIDPVIRLPILPPFTSCLIGATVTAHRRIMAAGLPFGVSYNSTICATSALSGARWPCSHALMVVSDTCSRSAACSYVKPPSFRALWYIVGSFPGMVIPPFCGMMETAGQLVPDGLLTQARTPVSASLTASQAQRSAGLFWPYPPR